MNLQNFCQRGGLALLALGATGYAGLATLRAPPTLAPTIALPRVEAATVPASPVIALPVAAPDPPAAPVSLPVAIPVSMAVNMPMMPPAAAPPVQAVLVTTCPMPLAAPPQPRPFRHVWEPRSHRWSRATIQHAGARGRSTTHAARADAAPYAARGWSDRRVD